MALEEIKKKGMIEISGIDGEVGLVAGRSQRERRRSYKDLLREEEEIAAQVRKSSKKRPKDSELFLLGGDVHKKKKKHSTEDYFYRDLQGSGLPPHKKKRKSLDRCSSSLSSPHPSTDTAMGLLQAITSPMATGSEPNPNLHKKPSYPSFSSSHTSSKERKREGGSGGSKGNHSSSHSRPIGSSPFKKHSSKSSLYRGGGGGEPLTLRDAEGLKMKLILSPKEKGDGAVSEGFPFPPSSSSLASSSAARKGGVKKEKDRDRVLLSKAPKKKLQSRDLLPMVGEEVELEGHLGGVVGVLAGDSSTSGGELEAGELVIDDSYTHLAKKKKKSKKSKKKKDKERDREKDRSGREKKHSRMEGGKKGGGQTGDALKGHSHSHGSANHSTGMGTYTMASPASLHHHHHQSSESLVDKKRKKEEKEEKERERSERERDKPKKKNMTAYQVFCKEYRVNINAEQPGLVFGELSRKLADVWKHLPEKDKMVWKQKAQYLQHKQNKAEAMTVKRKSSGSNGGNRSKGSVKGSGAAAAAAGAGGGGGGVLSPSRASAGTSLSPARVPDVDPIDAAAHLQLLGESLSLIGHRLQETEGMVAVSGSLSVLLDSILCALGPLACLTAQVPELNACPRHVLSSTLDNIAYIMPGL